MTCISEVQLCENRGMAQRLKGGINQGQRILIFDSYVIQTTVIYAGPETTAMRSVDLICSVTEMSEE